MKEIDIIIHLPDQKEETREGSLRIPKEGKPFFIFYKQFPDQRAFQSLDIVYGISKAGGTKVTQKSYISTDDVVNIKDS